MKKIFLLPMFFFLLLSIFYLPIYVSAQSTITLSSSSCGSGLVVGGTWNSATGECDVSSSQTLAGSIILEITSGSVLVIEPGVTFTIPAGASVQVDSGGVLSVIAGNGGTGGNGASSGNNGASGSPGASSSIVNNGAMTNSGTINITGGNGGTGGSGARGTIFGSNPVGSGGNGGSGGSSSIVNNGAMTNSGTINITGGNGGNGGFGGSGGFGPPGSNMANFNGGNGATGGNGGDGFIANHASIANSGTINGNGGNGGNGGIGGADGASFPPTGAFPGGSGGSDGSGGNGGGGSNGAIGFVASNGNVIGAGGNGASGGNGGSATIANNSSITNCGTIHDRITGNPTNVCQTTTTSLSSSDNPSTFGQHATITATVSPSTATGTVTFDLGGSIPPITQPISGGQASIDTSTFGVGSFTITAQYSGDLEDAASTSSPLTQVINQIVCPAGSFLSSGSNTCTPSPPGSYVPLSGSTSATQCVAGTFQPNYNSTSCIPSPPGSFVPSSGETSATLCSVGTFTDLTGQIQCTPAPAGSYVSSTGATSSLQCLAGFFQPNTGSASCNPADSGNFVSETGSASETQCPVGTYQPNTGSISCVPAPTGSFVGTTGASSANLCPVGTFTDSVGQSLCTPASSGSFVNAAGSTSSTLCLPGSYQPLTGQTSCLLADSGFYVNSSGATQQTQCPAGQSSNAGATSCFVVDTAPPTISITQPTDDSVLDHISSINGTASDDTSVSSVSVSVDGGSPQSAVYSSGTWTLATTLSTGMHTANATATDSVGHKTSTEITHFIIFASTQGRVTGGGHIGQDQNFGFEVKSDDDHKKSITGHLEYHDKSKKIDLDGKKITSLSVYDSSKQAAFIGQGQIHNKDKTMYSFFVQVYDSDKSGDHDTFSITITDSSGAVIYQNSGVVHGHIEIHKFADKDDKSDSGISH